MDKGLETERRIAGSRILSFAIWLRCTDGEIVGKGWKENLRSAVKSCESRGKVYSLAGDTEGILSTVRIWEKKKGGVFLRLAFPPCLHSAKPRFFCKTGRNYPVFWSSFSTLFPTQSLSGANDKGLTAFPMNARRTTISREPWFHTVVPRVVRLGVGAFPPLTPTVSWRMGEVCSGAAEQDLARGRGGDRTDW